MLNIITVIVPNNMHNTIRELILENRIHTIRGIIQNELPYNSKQNANNNTNR